MARYRQVNEILAELDRAGTSARLSENGSGAGGTRTASQTGDVGLTAPYSSQGIDAHLPGMPSKAPGPMSHAQSGRLQDFHSRRAPEWHCDDFSIAPTLSAALSPRDDYRTTAHGFSYVPNAPQDSRPRGPNSASVSYFCSDNEASYPDYPSPSRMSRLVLDLKILGCFLGIVAVILFVIWDLAFK